MEGNWIVLFNNETIGRCNVERRGLYCHISCRCGKVGDGICRLMLQCGDGVVDLGILVPMDGGFGLEKRLPAKNLPEGQPHFRVKAVDQRAEDNFVPVRAGEPFAYLSRLQTARFARRDGEAGVILD